MLSVGIIKSDTADHKLYYEVNQRYDHYVPLRAIFADDTMKDKSSVSAVPSTLDWQGKLDELGHIKLAVLAGIFVQNSGSNIDILMVGNPATAKTKSFIKMLEKQEGRELNYSVLPYDEFYYRLSVRDKFITELLAGKHIVLRDQEKILK